MRRLILVLGIRLRSFKISADLQKAAEGNKFDPILNMVSDDIMINSADGST